MNRGEERLVEFQFGMSGGFITALFHAIGKADPSNNAKLAKAFPQEVEAYNRFKGEDGYWKKLLAKYNQKHKGVNLVD